VAVVAVLEVQQAMEIPLRVKPAHPLYQEVVQEVMAVTVQTGAPLQQALAEVVVVEGIYLLQDLVALVMLVKLCSLIPSSPLLL
jgi:molybdopterin biosynthesis enzyme